VGVLFVFFSVEISLFLKAHWAVMTPAQEPEASCREPSEELKVSLREPAAKQQQDHLRCPGIFSTVYRTGRDWFPAFPKTKPVGLLGEFRNSQMAEIRRAWLVFLPVYRQML
jgi:hypothetical protein